MRILVTTTRMSFTLSLVRKLARAGHEVFACDTFDDAPGNHSRFSAEHFVTASPRFATRQWIDDLKKIIHDKKIELYVPAMEEVFYVGRHLEELSAVTRVLASPLEKLAPLHHKAQFQALAQKLGLRVPGTVAVTSQDDLKEALGHFPKWCARPSFSRGGATLLANTGPRAGLLKLEECHPSPENPWLVQEFIEGTDLCSYSIARGGRIVAHCCYETPVEVDESYGVEFLSVDRPAALEMIKAVAAHLGHEGHISFDFKQTESGPCFIECNPRCTNGALLMPGEHMAEAITSDPPSDRLWLTPPGQKAQVAFGMAATLFDDLKHLPRNLKDFLTVQDAYIDRHDLLPALYAFMTFRHFDKVASQKHASMIDCMLEDVTWNGEPMD